MKLKNKVAIVTGGTSGIGKATALLFAKEGAKVVIADIDENGKDVVNEIGSNAIFVKCDVTSSKDVQDMVNTHELPEDLWDKTIDTMERDKKGVIINNSSSLGIMAEPESPAYCSSKAAVIHLTKVMALEYAKDNIRVNCVCPGPVDTPMFRKAFRTENESENYAKNHTVTGRMGKPEDVAKVVLFLASDDASYITGSAYSVDGGESIT